MKVYLDYKCEECGNISEHSKHIREDWYESRECPECGGVCKRVYGGFAFGMAKGNAGNAENGYSTEFTYHPSKFGKFKGKGVKNDA